MSFELNDSTLVALLLVLVLLALLAVRRHDIIGGHAWKVARQRTIEIARDSLVDVMDRVCSLGWNPVRASQLVVEVGLFAVLEQTRVVPSGHTHDVNA